MLHVHYAPFAALTLLATLASCAAPVGQSSQKLQVIATTTIVGDIVSIIGGEHIELNVLLPAEADPHAFEPAPRDAALVSGADLVFMNGLGLDSFIERLIPDEVSAVEVSNGIQPLEGEEHSDEGEEGENHEHEELFDPHVWQDPANVIIWVENITTALAEADPDNSRAYEANASAYIAELNELDAWIKEQVSPLPLEKRVLVTDHEALGYFAHRYEFEIVGAVIPSSSTVAAPSALELAELESKIAEHNVPAIFIGTSANPELVTQLAADLGVEIVPIYGEALSDADGPAPTYLEMMRYNVEAIFSALH
jgi:zinc/manganese transport system substrate-binding protein